jgi:hypothetical protein
VLFKILKCNKKHVKKNKYSFHSLRNVLDRLNSNLRRTRMKKLKKLDFKKLAWKGIAAGTLLASQASANPLADGNSYANLLAANCSSVHGCHTQGGNNIPQSSCSQSSNAAPTSGCNSASGSNGYTANNPSHGCGASTGHPPTKFYYTDNQGKWLEGQPPQEYTTQPANPNQDQKVPMKSGQYNQSYQNQNPQAYQQNSQSYQNQQSRYLADAGTSQKLTQESLSTQLNAQTRANFEKMTPEGKTLAVKLANQSCKGQNDCKGLNSCKTETNSCAGLGSCKGTSKGPFEDKNAAVTVAAKAMAEKRAKATNSSRY